MMHKNIHTGTGSSQDAPTIDGLKMATGNSPLAS